MICSPHQYYSGDEIKNEMGKTSGSYGRQERVLVGSPEGTWKT
jgi:hypothetical protein